MLQELVKIELAISGEKAVLKQGATSRLYIIVLSPQRLTVPVIRVSKVWQFLANFTMYPKLLV